MAAALDSVGIAFVLEPHAADALARKALEPVLTPFLPSFPGWSLRHPRNSRRSAATQAVIEFLADSAPAPIERSHGVVRF